MKTYSFLNTLVVVACEPIGTEQLTGWAEGDDVIDISRREDAATDKVGADGKMAVAISANKSGSMKFKLMQTSRSNKFLNACHNLQQNGGDTFAPVSVMFQDTYRQDVGTGSFGYIKKVTDVKRGAGINEQEWEIIVERLDTLLGDPAFVGLATLAAEAG